MMKAKLLFLATFIVGMSIMKISAQTTYEWNYVNSLQNEWLQKICTQGLDTVYIVGRNGLIAKSTNRTATWTKLYPVATQLNDIIFCNPTTGFAVGHGGVILKTTDAGVSWAQQNSGITENLNAIAATGINNIWAVGDNGIVLFSTNAGANWQIKDLSTTAKLNDISFRNNVGYIVGNSHTCFVTSDYGQNWIPKNITVNNPYNFSITTFDLKSVCQTQNHVCILLGVDFRGHTINIDNSALIPMVAPGGFVTSFGMKNDSIGYGFWGGCTTGSSGCMVSIPTINILSSQNYIESMFDITATNIFNDQQSDISCVNDSIGYIVSGCSCFKLKRYIPDTIQGIGETGNKKLSIQNTYKKLIIQFETETIDKIELYNTAGLKIYSDRIHLNEMSKAINITNLSKGIYIIRACYKDNTFSNIKWIKQ